MAKKIYRHGQSFTAVIKCFLQVTKTRKQCATVQFCDQIASEELQYHCRPLICAVTLCCISSACRTMGVTAALLHNCASACLFGCILMMITNRGIPSWIAAVLFEQTKLNLVDLNSRLRNYCQIKQSGDKTSALHLTV